MSTNQQSELGEFDQPTERDVYITRVVSRGAAVYHTDSECQHITENHRLIPLSSAKDRGLDECKYCSGELEPGKSQSTSKQCGALTTDGKPCRMQPLAGFDRCSTHFGDVDETDDSSGSDDRPVWEREKLGDSE